MQITCPHCLTRITVSTEGNCPACGNGIDDSAAGTSLPIEEPATRADAWTRFLQSFDGPALPEPLQLGLKSSTRPPAAENQVAWFHAALRAFTPHAWVTPVLVIANIAIFGLMALLAPDPLAPTVDTMVKWGANFGPKTMHGEWWRLLTCAFLHFNVLHVGFNMWVLWDVGRLVERLVGNAGFIVLYLASAIFGSLASLAWNSLVVSAGASGAVFGVCGALLGFLAPRRDSIPPPVLKSLRNSMMTFVVFNIIYGLRPGTDIAAHFGGFVAGFACGLAMSQPLGSKAISARWRRNLASVCVATGLVPVTIGFLPSAPPDVAAEMAQLGEIETTTMTAYNEAFGELQKGTIGPRSGRYIRHKQPSCWCRNLDRKT